MFAEGDAYERFMGRWSRRIAPLFLQFARVRDGDAILDVGAGTGALGLVAAGLMPRSDITGVDPSPAYVARARTAAANPRARFEVGDAQSLAFEAGRFDRTLSLLVLNFVPDPSRAVGEMIRVTRRGGIVAAAVWDYGDGMEMLRIFWDEVVAVDPASEGRDERHMPLCRKGELSALWRAHGLTDIEEQPLSVRLDFGAFDDCWEPFLGAQGPAGVYVASLAGAARARLRDRLRARLLNGRPDGPFALNGRAWAVRGTCQHR